MKVLSLVSQKGGVGRSSLAAHLSVAFEEAGLFTVVVDLDNQGSTKRWRDSRTSDAPVVVGGTSQKLQAMLETTRKAETNLVIVDTPPYSSEITLAAVSAADLVVVPARPSILDLRSIADTAQLLKLARKLPKSVAILNAVRPGGGGRADEAADYVRKLGLEVAPVQITDRVAFSDAMVEGLGITEFEPRGKAAEEVRALRTYLAKRMGLELRG